MTNKYISFTTNEDYLNIPLSKFNLSARAIHVLYRNGFKTIQDLQYLSPSQLSNIRNVGKKTIDEIKSLQLKIKYLGDDYLKHILESEETAPNSISKGDSSIAPLLNGDGGLESDNILNCSEEEARIVKGFPISELLLPTGLERYLLRNNVSSIYDAISFLNGKYKRTRGFGEKKKDLLYQSILKWREKNMYISANSESSDILSGEYSELVSDFGELFGLNESSLFQIFRNNNIDLKDIEGDKDRLIYKLVYTPEITNVIRASLQKRYPNGFSYYDITVWLADGNYISKALRNRFFDEDISRKVYDVYFPKRPSILDEYEKIQDIREKTLFYKRIILGETLQEAADSVNITRERVRQIIIRILRQFPVIFEDYYAEPFKFFFFSDSAFYYIFSEADRGTYEYLIAKYGRGSRILNEENVLLYSGIFEEIIKVNGKKYLESLKKPVKTSKFGLLLKLIRHETDSVSLDDLRKKYNAYIENNGLDIPNNDSSWRGLVSRLRNTNGIVFNKKNEVRFIPSDFEFVYNSINFLEYKNCVISAQLIFNKYKALMDENDLRDCYELFSVIKNLVEKHGSNYDNSFLRPRRIPTLVFGDGSDEHQVKKLLWELAPIRYSDFYTEYENRYGVTSNVAMANLGKYISEYLINGKYVVDAPLIDDLDADNLLRELNHKEIWFIDELEELFSDVCKNSSFEALNSLSFKKIGYQLFSGYLISNKYETVSDFLKTNYFSDDYVYLDRIDPRLTSLSVFNSYLDKQKSELEYLEIGKRELISFGALHNQYGFTREDVKAFQKQLSDRIRDYYFNAHSINKSLIYEIANLLNINQICPLIDNEYFINGLLKQIDGFYSIRVSDTSILSKSISTPSVADVCRRLANENGKMDIDDLLTLFNSRYGTSMRKDKLAYCIQSKNMWDDVISNSLDEYVDSLLLDDLEIDD